MNLKYVEINEGGKVTMKEQEKMYTEEEEKLGDELCSMINADKELQMFFKERAGSILKKFAGGIIMAWTKKDKEMAKVATQEAGETLKALIMHVYIKVMIRKQEVK